MVIVINAIELFLLAILALGVVAFGIWLLIGWIGVTLEEWGKKRAEKESEIEDGK